MDSIAKIKSNYITRLSKTLLADHCLRGDYPFAVLIVENVYRLEITSRSV